MGYNLVMHIWHSVVRPAQILNSATKTSPRRDPFHHQTSCERAYRLAFLLWNTGTPTVNRLQSHRTLYCMYTLVNHDVIN